ncbi:hypothetical protein PoHVEF18_008994 [Penicillium ochrochloron]
MTSFSKLPDELLLLVADSLPCQKDIATLVRVNWRLYHLLHTILCQFNVQYHQGAGLLSAARNGHSSLVQKFLNLGANIASFEPQFSDAPLEYEHETRRNPLLLAAQNGYIETLEILLAETRPSRVCVPSQLRTVLYWAIGAGHQAIAELMVAHNVPLDPLADGYNSTPLAKAVEKGDEAIIECLLQAGAKTPSKYSLDDPLTIATHQKGDILLRLLKHGIRPKSDEILCYIAGRNDIASLQLLMQFGAEIAVYGHSALFTAIFWGHEAMVEFLIQQGANPHLCCERMGGTYSAIGHAIRCRQSDILKLLLAHRVRPDHQDLQLAIKMKIPEAVDVLQHLSYEDVPEKMTLEDCVRQREAKRLVDPDFQPMEWSPCVGLGSPIPEEYNTEHEATVCLADDDDGIRLDGLDCNVYLDDADYTMYSE